MTIKSVVDLDQILRKKFGDRYSTLKIRTQDERLVGLLDNEQFTIAFYEKEGDLLIAGDGEKGRETIEELKPVLSKVMGSEPLIRYDMKIYGCDDMKPVPHYEWNLVEPDRRLKGIITGREMGEKYEAINIELFNGKKAEDYLDTEEEKEVLMRNAKIYGIYPGFIDPEKAASASEIDIYINIKSFEHDVAQFSALHKFGFYHHPQLEEMIYSLDYLKYQTRRFGVEIPEARLGYRVIDTKSFQSWYDFYYNHFKEFNFVQMQTFDKLRAAGEDISEYLPATSWQDAMKLQMTQNSGQNTEGQE